LNILKNGYRESIASDIEIPELEPCSICNEEIFLHLFKKSFTVLTCGHIFHRLCLENIREKLPICPSKNCVAEIEIVERSPLIQTLSQRSMSIDGPQEKLFNPKVSNAFTENDPSCLDTIAEEDSNDNQSQNMESDIPGTSTTSTLPSKRAGEPTSADKPSSKKAKKQSKKEDSPVLKKLIDELSTDVSGTSEVMEEAREDTSNFLYLYSRIDQAESKNETTNQDVIRCYHRFGKALEDQFEYYKKTNPKRTAQALVNEEVRKQLPDSVSDDLLRKKKERAQKIYDLFNEIGEDTIRRIKSFTALSDVVTSRSHSYFLFSRYNKEIIYYNF